MVTDVSSQYYVIINPNAGKHLGMRLWPELARLLKESGIPFIHIFTEKPLDAQGFTLNAVQYGYRKIIIVGGDGTLNEAVNGLFLQAIVPSYEITLAMIPVGTGNDWGRMYGIPADHASSVKMIREDYTILQDLGIASYSKDGLRKERYFINVAGIGCDASVTFDMNRRKEKGGGGNISYFMSLMKNLLKYSLVHAAIEADGQVIFDGALYSANIGIGKYNGGGMMQLPKAIPDDGLFDITIIGRLGKFSVIRNLGKLYDGSFVKIKLVSLHRASTVAVKSNETVLLEVDGESLGTAPCEFRILPRAIRVLVPRKNHQECPPLDVSLNMLRFPPYIEATRIISNISAIRSF